MRWVSAAAPAALQRFSQPLKLFCDSSPFRSPAFFFPDPFGFDFVTRLVL